MTKAYLIGAGATNAQFNDAPLCRDFFQKLKDKKSAHFNSIETSIGTYLPGKLENTNVEDIMRFIHSSPLANKTTYLHSLHLAISELVVPSTKSDITYMQNYVKGEISIPSTHFRTMFETGKIDKNDFFMTLNYDLYLDREILYENDKINYGFQKDNIEHCDMSYTYNNNFSLYHLHGALNWEIIDNKIKIHHGAYHPKYRGTGFNLCLIPPGLTKQHPLLKPIWDIVENRMIQADELIIIGCSLNPTDKDLIDLVMKFVKNKGSQNVKIVYKAKDTPDYFRIDGEYAKIIGNKFKAYRDGFDNKAINFILDG